MRKARHGATSSATSKLGRLLHLDMVPAQYTWGKDGHIVQCVIQMQAEATAMATFCGLSLPVAICHSAWHGFYTWSLQPFSFEARVRHLV